MDNNRRLIIRISRNSLSFSTVDEESHVVYEPYPLKNSISMAANLREALRTVPLLSAPYGRVLVMVDAPVLLVPNELFRAEEKETLYRHALSNTDQQTVMHAVIPDLNCVAVFGMQKDLRTVLSDAFAGVTFSVATAPVWRHLHQRSFTGPHQKLYGYCHDKRLEVFSFTQNRFRFYNAYVVNSPDNALYFLLSVWQQLALDAGHDELHLTGDFPDRDALAEEARQYVKRVFVINPAGEFNRSAVTQIDNMPYDLMVLYVKGR